MVLSGIPSSEDSDFEELCRYKTGDYWTTDLSASLLIISTSTLALDTGEQTPTTATFLTMAMV